MTLQEPYLYTLLTQNVVRSDTCLTGIGTLPPYDATSCDIQVAGGVHKTGTVIHKIKNHI